MQRKYSRTEKRNAFTLVEMLVVIAIIGILASLLAPSLTKALNTAKRLSCTNKFKNMGVALGSYSGDAGGNWFPAPVGPGRNYRVTWMVRLMPYYGVATNIPDNVFSNPAEYTPGIELPVSVAPAGLEIFTCPFDKYTGYGGRARSSFKHNNGGDSRWVDGTSRTGYEPFRYDRLVPRYTPNYGSMKMGLVGDCMNKENNQPGSTVGFSGNYTSYWGFRTHHSPHPDMGINLLMPDYSVYYLDGLYLEAPDPLARPWMQYRTK